MDVGDNLTRLIITCFGLGTLVLYSIKRRFKAEKPSGLFSGIEYYRIEIIHAAVLVPQWADWLPAVIAKTFG
jgi:hypothetical protein